ncbi:MAG: multidrug effflux MFS transporter [Rhodocyclaceae bacterium]|nr:multidrug effflux MFS transporter [Rhodocyclaceae bacterium]
MTLPLSRNTPMAFAEFVAFVAACMALNALAIDVMLPALPDLNADFFLHDPNQSQAVIAVYLLGMGASQLIYGPLSDRFGRRPVLIGGLVLFSLAGLLSAVAPSFPLMLAARFVQGLGAGAPRVIAVSLARDTYSGRQLGRVMSLAMMVFMAVPILAPSLGQLILLVAPWRWAFGALVLGGGAVLAWTLFRLEESLPLERRRPMSPAAVIDGFRIALTTRSAMGYMLAMGLVLGAHMGFITSAQRIFMDIFDAGQRFSLLFALVAMAMSVAAFTNSRLVMRFGMRRLAIVGLGALVLLNAAHLLLLSRGPESLPMFLLMQAGSMFLFGFLGANLNALAMEPLGHVAGTASSLIGFFTTVSGALLGFGVGQLFDGSVVPLTLAYVVLGTAALGVVMRTGRGVSCAAA